MAGGATYGGVQRLVADVSALPDGGSGSGGIAPSWITYGPLQGAIGMAGEITVTSSTPVAVAYFNPSGQIWNNTTSTWEAIPTTGTPASQHLTVLAPLASAGSLAWSRSVSTPDAVLAMSGSYANLFNCSANGALAGTPSDLIGPVALFGTGGVTVTIGGFSR